MLQAEIKRTRKPAPFTYRELDLRQRVLQAAILRGERGRALLSEVEPVITLGRRTEPSDLLTPPELLRARGVELLPVDRGGLATYHGPGQWVLFLVESLERLTGDRRGVRKAVEGLLATAQEACGKFIPSAEIRSGCEMGVWGPAGKLAALGVHIEKGVLLHGIAVNVYPTPTSFLGLRPCGLDAPVGFLAATADQGEMVFESVGAALLESAQRRFPGA